MTSKNHNENNETKVTGVNDETKVELTPENNEHKESLTDNITDSINKTSDAIKKKVSSAKGKIAKAVNDGEEVVLEGTVKLSTIDRTILALATASAIGAMASAIFSWYNSDK